MMFFLAALIIGGILAYVGVHNTTLTSFSALGYTWTDIPQYVLLLISFLAGVAIAWVFSLFGWFSSTLTIVGKNLKIKQKDQSLQALERKVSDLEAENAALREKSSSRDK